MHRWFITRSRISLPVYMRICRLTRNRQKPIKMLIIKDDVSLGNTQLYGLKVTVRD